MSYTNEDLSNVQKVGKAVSLVTKIVDKLIVLGQVLLALTIMFFFVIILLNLIFHFSWGWLLLLFFFSGTSVSVTSEADKVKKKKNRNRKASEVKPDKSIDWRTVSMSELDAYRQKMLSASTDGEEKVTVEELLKNSEPTVEKEKQPVPVPVEVRKPTISEIKMLEAVARNKAVAERGERTELFPGPDPFNLKSKPGSQGYLDNKRVDRINVTDRPEIDALIARKREIDRLDTERIRINAEQGIAAGIKYAQEKRNERRAPLYELLDLPYYELSDSEKEAVDNWNNRSVRMYGPSMGEELVKAMTEGVREKKAKLKELEVARKAKERKELEVEIDKSDWTGVTSPAASSPINIDQEPPIVHRSYLDYRALGKDRNLEFLARIYVTESKMNNPQNPDALPYASLATLQTWRNRFDWDKRLEVDRLFRENNRKTPNYKQVYELVKEDERQLNRIQKVQEHQLRMTQKKLEQETLKNQAEHLGFATKPVTVDSQNQSLSAEYADKAADTLLDRGDIEGYKALVTGYLSNLTEPVITDPLKPVMMPKPNTTPIIQREPHPLYSMSNDELESYVALMQHGWIPKQEKVLDIIDYVKDTDSINGNTTYVPGSAEWPSPEPEKSAWPDPQ